MGVDASSFPVQRHGPSFSLGDMTIVLGESTPTGQGREVLHELAVPWRDLRENLPILAFLSWQTRTSRFAGRDDELAELIRWAKGSPNASMKFVMGPGGVGKSRLAAEFAARLQQENWAAGFVDPSKKQTIRGSPDGTLLIIDDPEEHRPAVEKLFQELGRLQSAAKLRVLFPTRQEIHDWKELIKATRVESLMDTKPLRLGGLDDASALDVYLSTSATIGKFFNTERKPVNQEAIAGWLKEAPENVLALFVMAAALHNTLQPEKPEVKYKVPDILDSLVARELARLRNLASNCSMADRDLFAKVLAVATIAGGIPTERAGAVIELMDSSRKLPEHFDAACELSSAGLILDDRIQALKPDLVAAAFVVEVLSQKSETAPEMIWFALNEDLGGGIQRLARLIHDAEVIITKRQYSLDHRFAEAVAGSTDRAKALEPFLSRDPPPMELLDVAIAVWRTLVSTTEDRSRKARILNSLSVHLSRIGDRNEAITTGLEAVNIYEDLADKDPLAFEPDFAGSLSNLASLYSKLGKHQEALKTRSRAVEIYERLAGKDPLAFEPGLAGSLNSLGSLYAAFGKHQEALEACLRAVEIRERLAAKDPLAFESELAGSLNNLGNRYSALGKRREALETCLHAVEIRERLAAKDPLAFEPDLAGSLSNLGNLYSALGKHQEALQACLRAVEIRGRLAAKDPLAFEPELAGSLSNLGNLYSAFGERQEALHTCLRSVEIYERLAEKDPLTFEPELAISLNNLGNRHSALGERQEALAACLRAVKIREHLAEYNPPAFEPGLAGSLNNLGSLYSELGKRKEALEACLRATEIYERLAEDNPLAFEAALATSYGTLGSIYRIFGERDKSVTYFRNGISTLKELFLLNPAAFGSLMNNLVRDYLEAGEETETSPDMPLLFEIIEILQNIEDDTY